MGPRQLTEAFRLMKSLGAEMLFNRHVDAAERPEALPRNRPPEIDTRSCPNLGLRWMPAIGSDIV